MAQNQTVDGVLDFAIEGEEQAARFYLDLAKTAEQPWMAEVFKSFAKEEYGHKAKLLEVKKGGTLEPAAGKIADLKIAEYVVDMDPDKVESYQDALIVAMKREKAAFRLYTDLSEMTDSERLRDVFLALAQEEAKHKLRFEVEYDDVVLQEN